MIDVSKPYIKTQVFEYIPLGLSVRMTWRVPSTSEMRAYITEMGRFMAGKETAPDYPLQHGFAILQGIADGEWSDNGKPFSSDPASPDYRADWKDVIAKNDIGRLFVQGLVNAAFDGITMKSEAPEVPFPKSSGD